MNNEKSNDALIGHLKNKQLSAVTFVQDYVQFDFEGDHSNSGLSAYVWPTINKSTKRFEFGTYGYCDELQGLIRKIVADAFIVKNEKIQIEFDDGSFLEISLKAQDCDGPEAVMLQAEPGKQWNVWGPGYP